MNIVCVICRELLLPSEDIFYTPCGHTFHFPCLTQWLERSKTCPQCREKVSQQKIHRLYFNYSSNDSVVEDSTTLQSRVESLEFKLLLKEKDLKHYTSKTLTSEKQMRGLRKEIMRLENEVASKNSANFALHEQLKFLTENNNILKKQKEEIDKLKEQLQLFRNVQTLLNSSYDVVDEMIKEARDPQTFITYIKVLKQELSCSTNKRKDQRTMIKNLHQDVSSLTRERNILSEELLKRKNLEEELAVSENERVELERRLKMYEGKEPISKEGDASLVEVNPPVEKEIPRKECLRRPHDDLDDVPVAKKRRAASKSHYLLGSPIVISEDSSDDGGPVEPSKTIGNEENSPYLRLKSKGISALKELHAQRSTVGSSNSIFRKKKITNLPTVQKGFGPVAFDGFGGHSKPDLFPVMNTNLKRKTAQDAVKAKKAKSDENKTLGDFFINLV